ncbi:hypothetical protein [Solibacillus cecembensis]|uniref:hypothetical protein n=1 Tax=Solibacillus cecembensis TaxID=459347 RepID=UPI003D0316B2
MGIGNRIYYKANNGFVIFQTGELNNTEGQRPDEEIKYIDVPFGSIDYSTSYIAGVDIESGKPIVKVFIEGVPEEGYTRELEDALLLQTENETGGIL